MTDCFDALQVLRDNSVLDDEAYRAVLTKMGDSAEDTDDKRRIAYILWSLYNGNSCNPSDAEFDGDSVSEGRIEHRVLTDDEADAACKDCMKDSLWAFNADFMQGATGIDNSVFAALADKCEGANDAVLSIVEGTCGFDELYDDAVKADGRGHFLSSYDGNEDEYNVGGEYFYIYRIN